MSTDKTDTSTDGRVDPFAKFKALVRKRLAIKGISEREASRQSGFGVGYVNDFLKGRAKAPEADRILKLCETLDIAPAEAFESMGKYDMEVAVELAPSAPVSNAPGMVPLYSADAIVTKAWAPVKVKAVGYVPRLPGLEFVTDSYALSVFNDWNDPRYLPGETVYASPAQPVRERDFAVVRRTDGTTAVARVGKLNESTVLFQFVGAPDGVSEQVLPRRDIESMHRIVGSIS